MKSAILLACAMGWLFSWAAAQEPKPDAVGSTAVNVAPEIAEPARAYLSFWASELAKVAESGVYPFIPEKALPEAKRQCDAVVAAAKAGGRPDIAEAATLLLQAFQHASASFPLEKSRRVKPKDPKVAELFGSNPAGLTEGYLLKGFMGAQVRLARLLGDPVVTEKQIREQPDVDFSVLPQFLPNASPRPEKEVTDDLLIEINEDGTLKLDDEPITDDALKRALAVAAKKAVTANGQVLVTLVTGEKPKSGRILDVMKILSDAKITGVTITVGLEEF